MLRLDKFIATLNSFFTQKPDHSLVYVVFFKLWLYFYTKTGLYYGFINGIITENNSL